jgi:hypothetical protein
MTYLDLTHRRQRMHRLIRATVLVAVLAGPQTASAEGRPTAQSLGAAITDPLVERNPHRFV